MEQPRIRHILLQYLLGRAGEKENKAIDEWYASFDRQEPQSLSEDEAASIGDAIWAGIEPVTREEASRAGSKPRRIRFLSKPWQAAAALFLLAGAAGASFYVYKQYSCSSCTVAATTFRTGVGEKKWITLSDSSRVMLDAATTIRVAVDFSRERKVEVVDGEVFFDIKKDERRPFLVQSGSLTTTVLGTSFTVAAYREISNLSIGVVSGKVQVKDSSLTLQTLTANQEIVYNKSEKNFKLLPLDESLTAWQEGRLVLNDLSFDEMAAITRKNFGVDIVTNEAAVKSTRYTTELPASMSPSEAVEVLAAIHNLKILHKNNKTLFYQ